MDYVFILCTFLALVGLLTTAYAVLWVDGKFLNGWIARWL